MVRVASSPTKPSAASDPSAGAGVAALAAAPAAPAATGAGPALVSRANARMIDSGSQFPVG